MIDKRSKIVLYALGGLLLLLMVVESTRTRPLNWNESYTSGDKIPFGAYVLYDQLQEILGSETVRAVDKTPMEFLRENESLTGANYIFINGYLAFDETETEYLMEFVARGNNVFVSTAQPYGALADSLKLSYETSLNSNYYSRDTIRTRLVNQGFKDRSYIYTKGANYSYIDSYDTLQTTVLGEVMPLSRKQNTISTLLGNLSGSDDEPIEDASDDVVEPAEAEAPDLPEIDVDGEILTTDVPQVNFVEVRHGEGAFYFNLNPIAFTNYYMLKDKQDYVVEALSYLGNGPVYFDDYGKSGRRVVTSPLRFVLSQTPLRWAYFVALLGIALYMIFASKRMQRIVPVVEPLENSTVEFTRTIGNLYFESGDHSSIILKKINYFMERLRSTYYMNTQKIDEAFIKRLATKAAKPEQETRELINYIQILQNQPQHTEQQLKELNKRIEKFLKK